jgi:hypothetical protein
MANLEFIEQQATNSGPFEVTQLINSFLGALVHPWEELKDDLCAMRLTEAGGWPAVKKERPHDEELATVGDLIRRMRNGIAHGNISYLPGPEGEIKALRIWNVNRGRRDWGAILTAADLRCFLVQFVRVAEELVGSKSMQVRA